MSLTSKSAGSKPLHMTNNILGIPVCWTVCFGGMHANLVHITGQSVYDKHDLLLEWQLSPEQLCTVVTLALVPGFVRMQHPMGQVLCLALMAGDQ